MKLALGTTQFGLDYGVYNKRGRIPKKEVFKILRYSFRNGINVLDTAHAYGDSEKIIGEFIRGNKSVFKIVSKLPSCHLDEVENVFNESLKRLNLDKIYTYLIHNFKCFSERTKTWDILKRFKEQGRVEKIGFSLYFPEEIEYLFEKNIHMDIVQVPFSIFDQRFSNILPLLKESGIEVYVRSIFLQGLILTDPDELEPSFMKIKHKLLLLRSISQKRNIPLPAICINFALLNKYVEKVLIGVDSKEHLQEDIEALNYKNDVKKIYGKLVSLKESDKNIILPINWS